MLLSEVIEAFVSWASTTLAVGTVEGYRRHLDAFKAAVGDQAVDELRPHHLLTWGNTWHRIQAVQRCFSWASRSAELIGRNPFTNVRRPPLGQRRRILHRAELLGLLRGAAPDFRRYLLAARETIARPQELRALRWEMIHHDATRGDLLAELRAGRAVFALEDFKGRRRRSDPNAVRLIPITPRLGRMLARLAAIAGDLAGPVLLTSSGRAWSKEAVRLRMKRLRKRLGMGKDHRGENVVVYTLRHTGGTDAAAAGIRDRVLAELMGHTSTRTTARYQHLETAHLVDAMEKLSAYRRKRRTG